MNKEEQEIIESTKEFAKAHNIHYDQMTENMILNAMTEQLLLHNVSKCNCDGNDDVFEEQYVLQHLINNTWQVVGEKTNTVWKQGKKEDCIKWMDL
jgi:hypothetical protein